MNRVTTFKQLVDSIQGVHRELTAQAVKAVNLSLTLRNWLIGFHIAEYQLNGADRAAYGEKLLNNLATELTGTSNCKRRQLYDYLDFYRAYPNIVRTLSAQFQTLLPPDVIIDSEKVPTASAQLSELSEKLLTRLSYSHLKLLTDIEIPTKRSFYEIECLRGNWSVRELKRQIGSLYYERFGLSHDKHKLAELAQQSAESQALFNIRDPYIFEFLGLKPAEVMSESQLEDQLLGKLQEFLLELGHGFCFEVCRVDKRSASTSTALNLVDARCLSTLPPSTRRFATIQNVLTVRSNATTEESSVAHVGWAEQLRLEKHASGAQRQGLALPGFLGFDPLYALRHTGRDCRYPGHREVWPERYAIPGHWVPAIPAGTTARRSEGRL